MALRSYGSTPVVRLSPTLQGSLALIDPHSQVGQDDPNYGKIADNDLLFAGMQESFFSCRMCRMRDSVEPLQKLNYDMATVIMVCLGETERREKDILRLLGVLLSPEIRPGTKKKILEQEYGIPMTVEMEKEAETMCDYGRGLARKYAEKGRAEGLEQGLAEGRNKGIQQERNSNILGMLREKIPMETIARITKVSVEQIRELGKLNGVL